jgi:hypothetical protein
VSNREFCGPNAKTSAQSSKYQTKGKGKVKTTASTDPSIISGTSPLHSVRWERIIIDEVQFSLLIYF